MALKISDSRSFKLQPVKKNGFIFQFSKIPGNTDQEEALAFVCHKCGTPKESFETEKTNRINEGFNYIKSVSWQDLSCSFYDFIRNSNSNELSAADILYNWSCMQYNPLTGQMGYKTQYATTATLAQIDPAGNIIRAWNLFGIFPKEIDYGGDLDYGDGAATDVTCTFVYDLAVKVQDSKSSTESA